MHRVGVELEPAERDHAAIERKVRRAGDADRVLRIRERGRALRETRGPFACAVEEELALEPGDLLGVVAVLELVDGEGRKPLGEPVRCLVGQPCCLEQAHPEAESLFERDAAAGTARLRELEAAVATQPLDARRCAKEASA